jgi:hypothetical protein
VDDQSNSDCSPPTGDNSPTHKETSVTPRNLPDTKWRADPIRLVPGLVKDLYAVVARLESLFPGRRFTLDGHLVGSIGEVLAAARYGLELLPPSTKRHDARARDGRLVQVKATQTNSMGLRSKAQHLSPAALLKRSGARLVVLREWLGAEGP